METYRNYWIALPAGVDPQRIDVAALDAALRAIGVDLDGVGLSDKDEAGEPAAAHIVVAAAGDPAAAVAGIDWARVQAQ